MDHEQIANINIAYHTLYTYIHIQHQMRLNYRFLCMTNMPPFEVSDIFTKPTLL